jgi:putative flippase GtrA
MAGTTTSGATVPRPAGLPAAQGIPPPSVGTPGEARKATVDIVVPVHNEQRALPGCIRVLHEYLHAYFPFDWTITIVDNASSDATAEVAADLANSHDRVTVRRLERKGRGLALRTAWAASAAEVVAYMDVDLSTGLDALLPLVAALVNGHSDVAVGSRLAAGARTVRGPKRELISRTYNALIRVTHGARFSDAQCGFKAARTEVIRPLLDQVRDDSWFFDTELLLVAEHNGLRLHEVPVDWVEDADTRVHIGRTVAEDLRGLLRVARAKASGAATVPGLPRRPEPRPIHPDAVLAGRDTGPLWQIVSFALIGGVSTVATLLLYALFRQWWPALAANLVSLTLPTLLNTEANRRLTFLGSRGPTGRVRLQGLLAFALYYALTSGALLTLEANVRAPSRMLELGVLLAASIVGAAGRFVLLCAWLFKPVNSQNTGKEIETA